MKPRKPKPAKPEEHPGYSAAIRAFSDEFTNTFGAKYPWAFGCRDSDAPRVKSWLSVAQVAAADPDPGVERIRYAARAYFRAVDRRTAWPIGEPATTRHFTRDLSKWLQTDPDSVAAPRARPAEREDDRHAALDMLRQARLRLVEP